MIINETRIYYSRWTNSTQILQGLWVKLSECIRLCNKFSQHSFNYKLIVYVNLNSNWSTKSHEYDSERVLKSIIHVPIIHEEEPGNVFPEQMYVKNSKHSRFRSISCFVSWASPSRFTSWTDFQLPNCGEEDGGWRCTDRPRCQPWTRAPCILIGRPCGSACPELFS